MSQQQRVVQLSAASLALVFGRDEESSRAGGGKHNAASSSGQEIFADFKAQNLRSFWNKRLVKAMAEVHFQGWMENFVLLVQGNANNLEVLREAWMRRALRSPRGFVIRAVGDLSPMQMAPILQSQFIPLSEVLCSVISDMNAAHVTVNQEALISHMMKAHPGMTIPTQDILYNALGALIKERKIYHTGEGYFIVTPQTYFITNSVVKDKHWWASSENDPPSPPPITYLVSNESCMDATPEAPIIAHCKSCSCFSPRPAPSVQDHQSISECTGKSLRWPRDTKPSVQHQSTSTAVDYQPSEMSKSTTSRKDKEKDKDKAGRKFSLSLFRRNAGKKDKPKKEYATFSGQFPPAEWPVRDEDDLNNLPRDLEHAIIKRINPELTVDNLVRHTVLMKKLEEQGADKGVNRGMSTEVLASKQRHHSSKVVSKRPAPKTARSKKRAHSSREKQRARNKTSGCPADLEADYIPSRLRLEIPEDEPDHPAYEGCSTVDAKNVYKKRIENPFQRRSGRDTTQGSSHRGLKKREERQQGVESGERVSHRSKSWDPSRTKSSANETGRVSAGNDRSYEGLDERGLRLDVSPDNKPVKELGDYSSGYPDSSTLRIEDKIKHLKEGKSRDRSSKEERVKDPKHKILQDEGMTGCASDLRHVTRQTKDTELPAHPLPPQITYHYNTAAVLPSWPKATAKHRLSPPFQPLDSKEDTTQRFDHVPSHEQISNTKLKQMSRSSSQTESDGFSDEDQTLYQRVVEDEDACSSLYLNEDSTADSSEASKIGRVHHDGSLSGEGDWDSTLVEESFTGVHQEPMLGTYQPAESRWQGPNSQHHSSKSLISQSEIVTRWGSQFMHESPQEPDLDARPTEALESSIFDYCQASEVESDTETLHKSADEGDGKSTHWVCSPNVEESLLESFGNLEDLSSPHTPSQNAPEGTSTGETVENHSSTGDSGIDSPRTRVSLTSSSSVILEGLKRRSFLQDLEKLHSKSNGMRPQQSSLLQLTPVMNM
ncbi:storkhead-box protein 1 [Megalops cyprinoides]|uniref:storkhead-box protein 1 n=1 Tax=Megalops cyprinoides TaxID=118141 RepID=UPI0018646977|nr:storkhead-box protein 1 [Megalops cyprinoides]